MDGSALLVADLEAARATLDASGASVSDTWGVGGEIHPDRTQEVTVVGRPLDGPGVIASDAVKLIRADRFLGLWTF